MIETNKIHLGNCIELSKQLDDNSIDCIVTSPPYWNLRDYNVEGQIGSEPKISEYIDGLITLFNELYRALKPSGTCWVNLGDTYMNNSSYSKKGRQGFGNDKVGMIYKNDDTVKRKSLCQIPSRFAIAMTDNGWILRNEIIWYKKNAMPSSATDRFTVDFEKIFFFTKEQSYYFEQILEPYTKPLDRWGGDKVVPNGSSTWDGGTGQTTYRDRKLRPNENGKNKRCVWDVNTKPFKEAHFATFPEELIEPMIIAGCPSGGIVLDPFMGSGTTALVSLQKNRKFVGFELNDEYIAIANKRIEHLVNIDNLIQ